MASMARLVVGVSWMAQPTWALQHSFTPYCAASFARAVRVSMDFTTSSSTSILPPGPTFTTGMPRYWAALKALVRRSSSSDATSMDRSSTPASFAAAFTSGA